MSKIKELYIRYVAKTIEALPLILPAVLAAFGTVAVGLLIIGQLYSYFIIPIGLLAAAGASYAVLQIPKIKRPGSLKEQHLSDLIVVLGVAVWLLFNFLLTSQNVFVYRDPAIYTVAGAWLENNANLMIPGSEFLSNISGISVSSAGFDVSTVDSGYIHAQGLHLLPVLLGLVARVGGDSLMLHFNPVFGAIALISLYGFARLVVRPRWAILTTFVVAASLPMLHFSRDTFTEPLAMIFVFGALALIWTAQCSANINRHLWFIAGVTAGAGALTRIDAYITVAALVIFVCLYLLISPKAQRKQRILQSTALILGVAIPVIIGWLDLSLLSSSYYYNLSSRFKQQLALLAIALVVGIPAVILGWRTNILKVLNQKTKKWRGLGVIVVTIHLAAFLLSRPLWQESHHAKNIPLVGGLQAAAGNPIDSSRDYAEQTANWIAWYIGPVMALLGVVGITIAAKRSLYDKRLLLVPSLIIVLGTSLVFMLRPSITPDHVWASRRFLPVVIPGVTLFGALALDYLSQKIKLSYRHKIILTLVTLSLILGPPLFISYPFLKVRTYVPQLSQINKFCDSLPDDAAVVWVGKMGNRAVQSTRSFCEVPAVQIKDQASKQVLVEIAAEARRYGYKPFVALETSDQSLLPSGSSTTHVSTIRYLSTPSSLYYPPRRTDKNSRSLSIGLIQSDGNTTQFDKE